MSRSPVTLGVNLLGNDTSVALVGCDGAIIAVAEEERYSLVKGGRRWASPAWVLDVLAEFDVPRDEVGTLATARIQAHHELRPLAVGRGPGPDYWNHAKAASTRWLLQQLPECQRSVEVRHHLCHAASAFYPAPFRSAAVVTADGMGEVDTATIWHGDERGLRLLWSRRLPHSLGLAYEAVATWTGLVGVEKEGKLMGLAGLGVPRFRHEIERSLVRPDRDNVFAVSSEIAARPATAESWAGHLATLFGPAGPGGNEVREIDADVAASVQAVLEECLGALLAKAAAMTGESACAAAGGVFMNSVANGMLARNGPFEELWVQPLASDAGTSLGAALAETPAARAATMEHAFLGSDIGDGDGAACAGGLPRIAVGDVSEAVADLILKGKIVGWASGRSEVGPRALGHRSILADARDRGVRDVLNDRVKERELWRPFAPIVLTEDATILFDDAGDVPFMNKVVRATDPDRIAATVHVDGSARLQTVPPDEPELASVRELLEAVRARTGTGVLLNTSLNGRGQPIARNARDVVAVHAGCRLDALVLDGVLYGPAPGPQSHFDADTQPESHPSPSATDNRLVDGDRDCAWIVAPWWEPAPAVLDRTTRGLPWRLVAPSDLDELARGEHVVPAPTVVVAVPVWCEVAAMTLGSVLGDLVGAATERGLSVVLLDEDGRTARYDSATNGAQPVARWWAGRRSTP